MAEKPAWMRSHGRPWGRGPGRLIYENPWISVTEYAATAPTGRPATYGLVSFRNHAVAVLPLFDDGTTILVGQHRLPFADYPWEIPEGGSPREIDPLEGAKRELAEETGFEAGAWQEVLRAQLSNSVTDEQAFGYIATDLRPARGVHHLDDSEAIETVRAPFAEVFEAVMDGHIEDILTVAMVMKAHHMALRGQLDARLARIMLG